MYVDKEIFLSFVGAGGAGVVGGQGRYCVITLLLLLLLLCVANNIEEKCTAFRFHSVKCGYQ